MIINKDCYLDKITPSVLIINMCVCGNAADLSDLRSSVDLKCPSEVHVLKGGSPAFPHYWKASRGERKLRHW
jgi:hypothetical protein